MSSGSQEAAGGGGGGVAFLRDGRWQLGRQLGPLVGELPGSARILGSWRAEFRPMEAPKGS